MSINEDLGWLRAALMEIPSAAPILLNGNHWSSKIQRVAEHLFVHLDTIALHFHQQKFVGNIEAVNRSITYIIPTPDETQALLCTKVRTERVSYLCLYDLANPENRGQEVRIPPLYEDRPPCFFPDGASFAFLSTQHKMRQLYRGVIQGNGITIHNYRLPSNYSGMSISNFAMSGDGQYLVACLPRYENKSVEVGFFGHQNQSMLLTEPQLIEPHTVKEFTIRSRRVTLVLWRSSEPKNPCWKNSFSFPLTSKDLPKSIHPYVYTKPTIEISNSKVTRLFFLDNGNVELTWQNGTVQPIELPAAAPVERPETS